MSREAFQGSKVDNEKAPASLMCLFTERTCLALLQAWHQEHTLMKLIAALGRVGMPPVPTSASVSTLSPRYSTVKVGTSTPASSHCVVVKLQVSAHRGRQQQWPATKPVLPPASLKIRPNFSMKVSSSPSPLPTRRMREAYRSNSGRDSLRRPRLTLADCAGGPGSGVASPLVSASSALSSPSTEACSSSRSLRLLVGCGPAVSSGLSTARNQALDHLCSEGLHTSSLFTSAKAES